MNPPYPGQYNYGSYAPGMVPGMPTGMGGVPPGMGGPPGLGGAPGMNGPPGMPTGSPAPGLQSMQGVPSIPGIDLSASTLRFNVGSDKAGDAGAMDRAAGGAERRGGEKEQGTGRGRGGADGGRGMDRLTREMMQPPTRAEISRTICIRNLTPDMPSDEQIEEILSCVGRLRTWVRPEDVHNKPLEFGFAEFEDVESLEAASRVLDGMELPVVKGKGTLTRTEDGDTKSNYKKITVSVDPASEAYIEEWKPGRNESDDTRDFRLNAVREEVLQAISRLANNVAHAANANGIEPVTQEPNGDTKMNGVDDEGQEDDGTAVININIKLEDELSDIPAEQRASVAEEIKNFRTASLRQDVARARQEEAREEAERRRHDQEARLGGFDAPAGPGGANGVPVGPRAATGLHGAPSGPKGFRANEQSSGNQVTNGVVFLAIGPHGETVRVDLRADDDVDESDEELERSRKKEREEKLEEQYLEQQRLWIAREKQRRNAKERTREVEDRAQSENKTRKATMAEFLQNYDDKNEEEKALSRKRDGDLYYADPTAWARERTAIRSREAKDDDRDRQQEAREQEAERRAAEQAAQEAAAKEAAKPAPMQFSMKVGGNKAAAAVNPAPARINPLDRSAGDILDDDDDRRGARKLRRLPADLESATYVAPRFDGDAAVTEDPAEKERRAAARGLLAREIPGTTAIPELFAYDIPWRFLSTAIVDEKITPYVKKQVLAIIGFEDDFIVDLVVDGIKGGCKAGGLDVNKVLDPIKEVLEDDAELFVGKIWRLVAFMAEAERKNIAE